MNLDAAWILIDTTLKVGLGGVIAISAAWLFSAQSANKTIAASGPA